MQWLALLASAGYSVPKPVRSRDDDWVITVSHPNSGLARNCTLFEWIEGRHVWKSASPEKVYEIGRMIAEFQLCTPRSRTKRNYWSAEGLVGSNPKFGSLVSLPGVQPKQQEIITEARKRVLKKLRQFEAKFPQRQGLIHADLHFGNLLSKGNELIAIDFDDCGYGFHIYDLVIPLSSVEQLLGDKASKSILAFKDALIEGYCTKKTWDKHDEEMLPYFITARKLTILGWFNARSDHPRLKKYLKTAVARTISHISNSPELN